MAVVCNWLIYTNIHERNHKNLGSHCFKNLANSTFLLDIINILLLYCRCSIRLGTSLA